MELIMMAQSQHRPPLSRYLLPVALVALMTAAWVGAPPVAGQSFDCRNARYADEKAICHESRLGDLDRELSATYDKAGKKLSKQEREAFESNETAFVNARHRCGENQGCIEQSYRNRLQELQALLPDAAPDRSERRAGSTKRSDRQKASTADREKPDARTTTESERAESKDAKPAPAETITQPSERKNELSETRPAGALPPPPSAALPTPPPVETRSHRKEHETANTGSTAVVPPSKDEAEAALAGAAVSEKRLRHEKRSRHKDSVSGASTSPAAPPEPEKQPAGAAGAVPEQHAPAIGSSTAAAQPAGPPEKRAPKEKRSRHKEGVSAVSTNPAPSSEHEKQPASTAAAVPEQHAPGSGTAAVQPASPPEKRHSKAKRGTPASSNAPPQEAKPAGSGGAKWVDPAPSP
ncbi:MAG: hypothetical protein E6G81_00010 [Alphaproteobacteria bacterium]|nr:MAG: hypothetical protein E6G81_00010 [Alphaproteobacteria bacterium]